MKTPANTAMPVVLAISPVMRLRAKKADAKPHAAPAPAAIHMAHPPIRGDAY